MVKLLLNQNPKSLVKEQDNIQNTLLPLAIVLQNVIGDKVEVNIDKAGDLISCFFIVNLWHILITIFQLLLVIFVMNFFIIIKKVMER